MEFGEILIGLAGVVVGAVCAWNVLKAGKSQPARTDLPGTH